MSETPKTDSFTHSADETPWDAWVYAGHAMRLERERDEALKALKHIEEYGTGEINAAVELRQELAKARLELVELKDERDEIMLEVHNLKDALQWISARYCHEKTTSQLAQDAYEMACVARAALRQEEESGSGN